jgi:MFS family permease
MAVFYTAIPVGSALGYVIGGVVGAHFGWRWAFYLVTLPGLLLGLLCFGSAILASRQIIWTKNQRAAAFATT